MKGLLVVLCVLFLASLVSCQYGGNWARSIVRAATGEAAVCDEDANLPCLSVPDPCLKGYCPQRISTFVNFNFNEQGSQPSGYPQRRAFDSSRIF
eukprot:TRINITY_DN8950_c0_g1_i1.p1 TRINITY_DN8950_c0_g1~~TRINITY_DN8950_c0_g1_i1.p1  ORF type:complete len:110 (-),score=33.24 TRINITY_DN8950_c0_g1_i1:90-374(-)